ncbi:MAG: riboflavin synthase [Evtepia gabavorous]
MFTGIVEEMGTVKAIRKGPHSAVVEIQAQVVLEDLHIGDSIAVNGVCLTATAFSPAGFTADVMHETLNRSALALLRPGSRVNLERALAAGGRFGGHIVAGHVDGVGTVQRITRTTTRRYTIAAGPEILRYVVEKGSIAIDGISLTVARVDGQSFAISAIPHTVSVTTLAHRRVGDPVNLETDVLGKYVEKLLQPLQAEAPPPSGITRDFLTRCGF